MGNDYVVMYGRIVCSQGSKTQCYDWLRERSQKLEESNTPDMTIKRQWTIGRADLLMPKTA